jgi:hypothetical protein
MTEQQVLTHDSFIDILEQAKPGEHFYYKKQSSIGFNVRKIKDVMAKIGVEILYVGDASHVGNSVHQIKVLKNSVALAVSENLEPKFFDPKNLI